MIRACLWVALAIAAIFGGMIIPAALERPNLDQWAMLAGLIAGFATVKSDRAFAAMRDRQREKGK